MRKALLGTVLVWAAVVAWCGQGWCGQGWCGQDEGISGYAKAHKYFGADRKEFTYTITSVMQFAKPFDVADMNDDYQDARLIAEDRDSATVEITYYPLNTNGEGIGENPNWKRDYAHMTKYLAPTATENWDEKMRADPLAELRQDGIDPDSLTDLQVVTQVSRWLKRRGRFTNAFGIWYVHYPKGVPEVYPLLRPPFDKEKPTPDTTDQAMFDQEVLGRSMFYSHWKDALPAAVQATITNGDLMNSDFYIGIQEYIANYVGQMRDFEAHAGHRFVLASPGHPDLRATLSGMTLSNGAKYQMWGVRLDAESRKDIAAGEQYAIRPINTSETHKWSVQGRARSAGTCGGSLSSGSTEFCD